MEKNLDYLFNNVSLYTKDIFKIFELKDNKYFLNDAELKRFNEYIGVDKDKLVAYCHKCKKEFPFDVEKNILKIKDNESGIMILTTVFFNAPSGRYDFETGSIYGSMPPYLKENLLNNRICYIEYKMKCTNDDNHIYLMIISIEFNDGMFIVRKIGQNPSMLSIKGFDFDKYKKILEKLNSYEDYKKADLSNIDHFYVGAYAYLRRIFEKMISYYLGDKKLEDNHMDTKIEAVKENFDPRIRDLLKNLYGILSKSIHELDEDESREYYGYLKAIIDMQLEFMNTEEEKEKQTKELQEVIGRITNIVKKK